jgi:hypothetical protein
VNLAMQDAVDASRLIDDLARMDPTQPEALATMQRQRIWDAFGANVIRRHKAALHTHQAPSPFGR